MAAELSRAIGRVVSFVDVPPDAMRSAFSELGLPNWQADGLAEEFAMYRQGDAVKVEAGFRDALGRAPRAFSDFARDHAAMFSG